ncbi:MAG: BlaI/MecI/CopY family transcriptional regulator [Bacteroidales bacterium]|nr:BlaI/MecI/CopY family transcriptional regulator [Bacteroidales bacterium]
MEIRELTKAEEEVMQILWRLKKGFVKEILEKFEEPRPAYTTVSTIIRILQEKGFVDYKAYGRTHQYFPVITKDDYKKAQMSSFVKDYFSNSYQNMVSFFAREKNISVREMEVIMEFMRKDTNGKQIMK